MGGGGVALNSLGMAVVAQLILSWITLFRRACLSVHIPKGGEYSPLDGLGLLPYHH